MWKKVSDSIFLGYKINGDGDCSHEMKRCLFLERIAMMNLDSLLKSRDYHCITLPYSQSYGFSSSHVWMWELDHEEGWAPNNWCFQTVVLEKTPESLILKEINSEYSLEGLMLKLQFQYFGHLIQRANSLEKTLMVGKTEGRRRRGNRRWDGWMASLTQWMWV